MFKFVSSLFAILLLCSPLDAGCIECYGDGTQRGTFDSGIDPVPSSMSVWLNWKDNTDAQVPIGYHYDTGNTYVLFWTTATGGQHRVNNGGKAVLSGRTIPTDVWEHWAYTYDGTTLRFYINGEEVGTDTTGTTWDQSTNLFEICENGRTGTSFDYEWNGYIDEFAFWTKVLTADQIKLLATGITGMPEKIGDAPAIYHDFEEYAVDTDLDGLVYTDKGTSGNNLTMTGTDARGTRKLTHP